MKDKEKQVEEIQRLLIKYFRLYGYKLPEEVVELVACDFYENNVRKLTEDSVVISKSEYNDLKGLEKHFDDYLIKEIKETRKETVEKLVKELERQAITITKLNGSETEPCVAISFIKYIVAKQVGVEIATDDNCKYYDKANMRCNAAKCTPECYCNGHKSECTEYPETRKKFGIKE